MRKTEYGGMRFTSFSYGERYGMRLQRLTLDGAFTCPNRDGTLGTGGCTFCDNAAFHPGYTRGKSILEQLDAGIAFHSRRGRRAEGYLAYFQAFSNTYAPLPVLKERYEAALSHPLLKGLVIGTRPDCVDAEKLDYLASLQKEGSIIEVEYGIESVYDQTLQRVRRGHTFACTEKAIRETAERGIPVGGHIILGLPGETREMLLKEAEILSSLPLTSLKFHQLQIIKGTQMEKEFAQKPGDFLRMGPDEYVDLLVDILERLGPEIAIGRIASSVPPAFTDAPWGLLKHEELLRRLEARLEERNTRQGIRLTD
jgi:radical SAM protein (TIGR01212 family)